MPAISKRDIPKSDLAKATKWRRRAAQCRADVEAMTEDSVRRPMLLIATFYDELAKQIESQTSNPQRNEKSRAANRKGAET